MKLTGLSDELDRRGRGWGQERLLGFQYVRLGMWWNRSLRTVMGASYIVVQLRVHKNVLLFLQQSSYEM